MPSSSVPRSETKSTVALDQLAAQAAVDVQSYRGVLSGLGAQLAAAFREGVAIDSLVRARTRCVDALLVRAWRHFLGDGQHQAAMIAVGGYGRGELLPHSDIDLLLLYRPGELEPLRPSIEALVAFLWDTGLHIGHSVRSPAECALAAKDDATIITNLMEARLLTGDEALFAAMNEDLQPTRLWPADAFFRAKLAEQQVRHARFDDTAYHLEPNVKESPGGLRDIQIIAWVAKRRFGAEGIEGLVRHGFLNEGEYTDLRQGQSFLWKVRFALHEIAARREDRLLFDHQLKVADLLAYQGRGHSLAVERFMQKYYQTIKSLSALNDTILHALSDHILHHGEPAAAIPLNARFALRRGRIAARDSETFRREPAALLELFRLMQNQLQPIGIDADTLRLLRRDRGLIDPQLRAEPRCRSLFLDILRQGSGVTHALRQMNRYGILGRYLPAFGQIIGRMQYDLFHTLTVDEHSLFVVRNLRRLAVPEFAHELPFASRVMQALDKKYLLYIAGLFHDIAKGRGGDHSELGAEDAAAFCADHGIEGADRDLVCWLVRQHLLMSMTAQRKDINDPAVIHAFAREVGNRDRLDRLFVFTVCDIRGTNPSLWNSWRKTLLMELYENTRRSFDRGLDNPLQQAELAAEARSTAAALLTRDRVRTPLFKAVWARVDQEYFLRHSGAEIAWHTAAIVRHQAHAASTPLVLVDSIGDRGVTVFVYTRHRDHLFALTVGVLAQLGLSILDARIATTHDGHTLDSYVVTEAGGGPIVSPQRFRDIETALVAAIVNPEVSEIRVTRRASRRSRAFSVATQVTFRIDALRQRSVMELTAADRPGLLSRVGHVFRAHGILVETAKIATIGERAEDIFYVTDRNRQPLSDGEVTDQIAREITHLLDRDSDGGHDAGH